MHAEVQVPDTQNGVEPEQSALVLQPVPGLGTHAPLTHIEPEGQVVPEQAGRHLPSSQTSPVGHWLEYLQTVFDGSQAPATHTSPPEQSLFVVHGQGPLDPPHVTHEPI